MNARGIPLYSLLAEKAQKANIAFSPQQIIMLMAGVSVVAYVGLSVGTSAGLAVRIAVAIAMGIGGVYVWINNKAKKRLSMIEEQLPDAVELMVRSLARRPPVLPRRSRSSPRKCPTRWAPKWA